MLINVLKKTIRPILFTVGCFTIFSISSCDDEDDVNLSSSGSFVLSYAILGSTGDYAYYTVQYDSVMSGTLTAEAQGITQTGYHTFEQIENKIYCIGGLGENTLSTLEKNENDELESVSELEGFNNSINDIVETEDDKLLAVEVSNSSDVFTFHILDPETTDIEETVSVSTAKITSFSSPAFSGMVQSGDYVYVSYYISDPTTYATNYTDTARIAVFSYPELEFVKNMKDSRTGPIGGYGDGTGLFKDDEGSIYALSHSNLANGYSQNTKDGAMLKINAGDTVFDEDYYFDMENLTGGLNTAHVKYLENGILFTLINTVESSEQTAWSDSPLKGAIIDLNNKTINYIDGLPVHSGTGRTLASTSLYDDGYIYLCIPEEEDIYVYQVDINNYTAVKGALVDASFVGGFFKL